MVSLFYRKNGPTVEKESKKCQKWAITLKWAKNIGIELENSQKILKNGLKVEKKKKGKVT